MTTNTLVKNSENSFTFLQILRFYKKDSLKRKIIIIVIKKGFIKSFMKIL